MAQEHIVGHLGKLGLKKICAGLGTKFKASPTDPVVAVLAELFDKYGTGTLSTGELNKAVQLLGAQMKLGVELNVRSPGRRPRAVSLRCAEAWLACSFSARIMSGTPCRL